MGAKTLTRPLREESTRGSKGGYKDDVVALVVRKDATYHQLDFKESRIRYCRNLDPNVDNTSFFISE